MSIRRLLALRQLMVSLLRASLGGLLGTSSTLSQQVARGGVWVLGSHGLQQILSLVRSIILARLSPPADFGLIGMASVAIAFLLVLTESGIAPAIMQRAEIDEATLNSAWVISVAAVAGGLN